MGRALIALALCATAICGVKGAPRPPEKVAIGAGQDAGPAGELFAPNSPGQPLGGDSLEANEPDPFAGFFDGGSIDAGCEDAGSDGGAAGPKP